MMNSDAFLAREILRYGAYVCIRPRDGGDPRVLAAAPIPALAERLGLVNEFDPAGRPPPSESIAFLRRHRALPGQIEDEDVAQAPWVVHVVSPRSEPVAEFCAEVSRLLAPAARTRTLSGVVRPMDYTGGAMQKWAYERRVIQQPATAMPNAFLLPMSKTAQWWRKDWMERHTHFLPRYDAEGRMLSQGHALAAEEGIACLLRRTYKAPESPAPAGAYDFITYFECADADVAVFEQVCARLRDVKRNPEWAFVREGPTWHGRRTRSWEDLFSQA